MKKRYSWRSYTFLIISILLSLSMVLLDPIATSLGEEVGSLLVIFIIVTAFVSIILAIITMITKTEKKVIAVISLVLTVINIAVIVFIMWLGASFAL